MHLETAKGQCAGNYQKFKSWTESFSNFTHNIKKWPKQWEWIETLMINNKFT